MSSHTSSDTGNAAVQSSPIAASERRVRQRRSTSPLAARAVAVPPSEHNQKKPFIHRLPVELFTTIIYEDLLENGRRTSRLERVAELSVVCVAWRDAIADAPFLWTNILSSDGKEKIKRALANSKTLPLDLVLRTSSPSSMSPDELIQLFLPHVARWKSLKYQSDLGSELSYLRDKEAPILETLGIDITSTAAGPLDLFQEMPTTLRELHLWGCPFPWVPQLLKGFTSLSFQWMGGDSLIPSALLQIVSGNPNLASLCIRGLSNEPTENETIVAAPIHLSQLKNLTIDSISRRSLHQILPNLIIPNCDFLYVELPDSIGQGDDTSPNLPDTMEQTLERVAEHVAPRGLSGGTVDLTIDMDDFVCEVQLNYPEPGVYAIRCTAAPWITGTIAQTFLARLPNPKVKVIDTSFQMSGGAFDWCESLQDLSIITSVQINNEDFRKRSKYAHGGFGEWIAKPSQGEDGVWRWSFPGLGRIHWGDYLDDGWLLKVVSYRSGETADDAWKPVELPTPFKHIHMRGVDPGVCNAAQEIVGHTCLVDGAGLEPESGSERTDDSEAEWSDTAEDGIETGEDIETEEEDM